MLKMDYVFNLIFTKCIMGNVSSGMKPSRSLKHSKHRTPKRMAYCKACKRSHLRNHCPMQTRKHRKRR